MKKRLGLLALLFATVAVAATTYTTNYQLAKPGDGDKNYGSLMRGSLDTIDSQLKINADGISAHIADPTDAHDATALSTTPGSFVCTTSLTVQNYLDCLDGILDPGVSGVVLIAGAQTITGSKTFSITPTLPALSPAGLVQVNGSGVLSSTPAPTFNGLSPLTTKGDLLSYDTGNVRVPVGINGQVLTADSSDAQGVIWDYPNTRWRKFTYDYDDFADPALFFSITMFSLQAEEVIEAVVIHPTNEFDGGATAAYTIEVGQPTDLDEYSPAYDAFTSASNTLSQSTEVLDVPNFGATSDVVVTARCPQGMDEATAGSVDIYIKTSLLP